MNEDRTDDFAHIDAEYSEAVRANDILKMAALVRKMAKQNGYKIAFHGTNSSSIVGKFNAGSRDSGWFGSGAYLSENFEYASRWGPNVLELAYPTGEMAKVQVVGEYEKIKYLGDAQEANENAGGSERFILDQHGWSQDFKKYLENLGYTGVNVDFDRHKNIEIVVFDPDKIRTAEPIARNNMGTIIPINKRFDCTLF